VEIGGNIQLLFEKYYWNLKKLWFFKFLSAYKDGWSVVLFEIARLGILMYKLQLHKNLAVQIIKPDMINETKKF